MASGKTSGAQAGTESSTPDKKDSGAIKKAVGLVKKWQTRVSPVVTTSINLWVDPIKLSTSASESKLQIDPKSEHETEKLFTKTKSASCLSVKASAADKQRFLQELVDLNNFVGDIISRESERLEFIKMANIQTNNWQETVKQWINSTAEPLHPHSHSSLTWSGIWDQIYPEDI